jgi:pimeloyl-ACP methyl ester carboxylesterase
MQWLPGSLVAAGETMATLFEQAQATMNTVTEPVATLWEQAQDAMNTVADPVSSLIHPPREVWSEVELDIEFPWTQGRRMPLTVTSRGNVLQGTMLMFHVEAPAVLYCHGHGSSRFSGFPLAEHLLAKGMNFVAFDWAGQGASTGNICSLGAHEKDDLHAIVVALANHGVQELALYGRSMGGATVMLEAPRLPGVSALVVDSSFCDLTQLLQEQSHRLVVQAFAPSFQQRAGFDVSDVCPVAKAGSCGQPALFIAGRSDTLTPPHHIEALHTAYKGTKALHMFDGTHSGDRPACTLDLVSTFLGSCLWKTRCQSFASQEQCEYLRMVRAVVNKGQGAIFESRINGVDHIVLGFRCRFRRGVEDRTLKIAYVRGKWVELNSVRVDMPHGAVRYDDRNQHIANRKRRSEREAPSPSPTKTRRR